MDMTVSSRRSVRTQNGLWTSLRVILTANRLMTLGVAIIVGWFLLALLSPLIVPHGPEHTFRGMRLVAPCPEFPMGTDSVGRDILARVLYGFRYDALIAFSAVALGLVIGLIFGSIAAVASSHIDNIIMRFMDILFAFPSFLLALVVAGALGRNMFNLIISISVVFTPLYARLVRGNLLSEKEKLYVEAGRSVGVPPTRMMIVHLLPNATGPVITQSIMTVAWAVMTGAGISFLGFGVQPPTPEWGLMISDGAGYIVSGEWWVSFFPGIAIFILIAALTLIDDGLRTLR